MDGVVVLGSGGWISTSERATCSALVRRRDAALLIDAGTGVGRLVERPDLLEGIGRLDLILTHFHLDHVVGLSYLPALPLRPRLHAPGQWLYGASSEEILTRLLGPPLFALGLDGLVEGVSEIGSDGELALPAFDLVSRPQHQHNHPTLALRVGDLLTYCTDTAYDSGNIEFAARSRFLFHEAWYTEDAPRDVKTHSSAKQAALIASEAGVERMAMIHIRPGAEEERLLTEARSVFQESDLSADLVAVS
jgi:ribonuclease BN (tRNA processing enzyme)